MRPDGRACTLAGVPTDAPSLALFSSSLPGFAVERIVAAAAALEVGTIEWGAGPGQAIAGMADAERARARCAARGLAVAGLSVQDVEATLDRPERLLPHVRDAAELGAGWLRAFPPALAPAGLAATQRACRDGLARLVEAAAPHGLRVLVEVSPGTVAPSPALLRALLDGQPPDAVGALYDPGNMAREGHVAPRIAVEQLGPYLAHVHLKNVAWRRRDGAWGIAYARLADGVVDWPEVLAALVAAGYDGLLAIDHLRGAPSRAELGRELAHARALLADALGRQG